MNKAVVILGMHRSGTSALAGSLCACGLNMGDNLLSGLPDNPKGHFEDRVILSINDSILHRLGTSWNDIQPMPDINEVKEVVLKSWVEQLKAAIVENYRLNSLWGVKDPRIGLLLPVYHRVFKEMDIEPRFVVAHRWHDEICGSLKNRNGIDVAVARALINKYEGSIMAGIEGSEHYHVFFDNLISKPRNTLLGVIDGIQLPLTYNAEGVEGFLDRQLVNSWRRK